MNAFEKLLPKMQELRDLSGVIGLATWDQETYLPAKAEGARASQLGTLQSLSHERLVDERLGALLEEAAVAPGLTLDQQAMVRVLRWERDRAVRVPGALVRELAETQSRSLSAWRAARRENNFKLFQPMLGRLLELRRAQADALGHQGERYDALLENFEPGMRVARLSPTLAALKAKLIPLVQSLKDSAHQVPPGVLSGRTFGADAQWAFCLEVLGDMGFDLEAGRLDRSIHPFTGGTHPTDVRLTLRLDESTPLPALYGAIHEGGHGLYEQGFSVAHYGTPLAASPSMGLHESQSRLWENIVGRSRAFWGHYFPRLSKAFPGQLAGVSAEGFYAEVNRVRPSLIRVEADEVTYNLHIVLRYELELLLLRDALPLEDLPAAWNAGMREALGVVPPDDTQGVLQDIHWAWGELGYFPTYALGNLYAASLDKAMRQQLPGLEEEIGRGNLLPVRDWLRQHIHTHGFRTPAEERVRAVTGHGLRDDDFIDYLRQKYGALYQLSP